ncbi:MAG: hypothetical protein IJ532_03020 [Alphaproteobacteria bacterium]|nr:hypothetical protein [Alphaproteobacteria bacterium]
MINKYTILSVLAVILLAGCVEISDRPYERKRLVEKYIPQCKQETMVAVYDEQGTFEVPGCVDYYYPEEPEVYEEIVEEEPETEEAEETPEIEETEEVPQTPSVRKIKRTVKRIKKTIPQFEKEIDVDAVEGKFPDVERNKYVDEVILENQNTHVLAYCRGTEEEIEICVSRLENSCYVRIEDIPRFAAKYDRLKTGTYPTRRWREGEYFPRW